ncbi:YciI family protein [Subtercola sp. YIM 133946]|uniref:YciI family protein n=1 Tax=Subtercola sp. YIM 133946 TaxID=3118909 RepID=UPI002F943147
MYYVTLYTADPAGFARVAEVYPRHRAYLDAFAEGGGLWLIGSFGDPEVEGSMAVFRTRDAAEEFVANDPFVTEGLVASSSIREWQPLEFEPARASRTLDPANFVG